MDEESICGMWKFWSNCIQIEITLNADKTAKFWAFDEWEHCSITGMLIMSSTVVLLSSINPGIVTSRGPNL